MSDYEENLKVIWTALENYRENSIPEGIAKNDAEWCDICTAMAWIAEDLEDVDQAAIEKNDAEWCNIYTAMAWVAEDLED